MHCKCCASDKITLPARYLESHTLIYLKLKSQSEKSESSIVGAITQCHGSEITAWLKTAIPSADRHPTLTPPWLLNNRKFTNPYFHHLPSHSETEADVLLLQHGT